MKNRFNIERHYCHFVITFQVFPKVVQLHTKHLYYYRNNVLQVYSPKDTFHTLICGSVQLTSRLRDFLFHILLHDQDHILQWLLFLL